MSAAKIYQQFINGNWIDSSSGSTSPIIILSASGGEDGKYGLEQYLDKKTTYVKFQF